MSSSERRLIELRPWDRFDGLIVALTDKQMRRSMNGNNYLTLKVRDSTADGNAIWFSPPAEVLESLDGARLISLGGQVDGSEKYLGTLKLTALHPVEDPPDLSPWLPPLPQDHAAHKQRFNDLIRSIREPNLKELLKSIFRHDGETWARFERAPAAQNHHHAYPGGLLEHSGEVAAMCDRIASVMPLVHREVLVTAALLHDIGKLEEMESGLNSGTYTPVGNLVGHVVLGTYTVAAAAEAIEGFPATLKHELMHLILSHHGKPEWGAAREPACAEAIVLSLCDLMSARIAHCARANTDAGEDLFARDKTWSGGTMYFGLMRQVLANLEPPGEE